MTTQTVEMGLRIDHPNEGERKSQWDIGPLFCFIINPRVIPESVLLKTKDVGNALQH